MATCKCDGKYPNLGRVGCDTIFKVIRRLIFVPEIDESGDDNSHSVMEISNWEYFQDLINTTTPQKSRLYPTPVFDNVENTRAETVFQDLSSGNRVKIRDGFRTITLFIPGGDPEMLGRIKEVGCSDGGFYALDLDGNFIYSNRGNNTDTSTMYPIRFDKNTFDAQFVWSTYTETQFIMVTFQIKLSEKDEWLRMIPEGDLGWGLEDPYGLIPVYGTVDGVSDTEITIDLFALTSTSGKVPISGLQDGDITLHNLTQATLEDPVVSEDAEGSYTLTFSAQDPGDEVYLSIEKTRYTSEQALENVEIEIP